MALTDENMSTTMLVQPSGGINYGNMGGGIFGNDGLWLLLVLLLGGGWGGVFLLASNAPNNACSCGCRRIYTTNYEVEVHANIEIPTGGTVEEIQLAIAVDGVIDPSSIMSFTPAAVETAGNVGSSVIVSVPSICGCDSVAIVNASTQPITINNASLVFDYAGVNRLR